MTVKLVIKQQMSMAGRGSRQSELKTEATGTVIDPSGLTVLSLSATDPTRVYKRMMGGTDMGFTMESELADVKILLDDGSEVSSKVVLRDDDLDLAFIQPEEIPAEPMAAVDLTQSAEPRLLDEVIFLNRLGRVAGRAYAVSIESIEAVVNKPRTFYIPGRKESSASLGSPVFALDGKIIGVTLLRTITSVGGGGSLFGDRMENVTPIILPAGDVLEAAEQATNEDDEDAG